MEKKIERDDESRRMKRQTERSERERERGR